MYFLFFLLHFPHVYRSCDHLPYIILILGYIYIYIYMLFLLSLCAHDSFYLYAIFYFFFTLRCRDEFCLKCFRNTGCQSLFVMNSLLAKFFKSLR